MRENRQLFKYDTANDFSLEVGCPPENHSVSSGMHQQKRRFFNWPKLQRAFFGHVFSAFFLELIHNQQPFMRVYQLYWFPNILRWKSGDLSGDPKIIPGCITSQGLRKNGLPRLKTLQQLNKTLFKKKKTAKKTGLP